MRLTADETEHLRELVLASEPHTAELVQAAR
jgi:hypothetical protein